MKILIVSPDFYPKTSPRAVRWTHLSRAFSQIGWKVDVLTVTRVSTYSHARVLSPKNNISSNNTDKKSIKNLYVLRCFVFPDPHIVRILLHYMRSNLSDSYDVVISSGYPHSSHIIGLLLKLSKKTDQWVADLGDPWARNPMDPCGKFFMYQFVQNIFEKQILRNADHIVVTTEGMKHLIEARYPQVPVSVIPNGYMEDLPCNGIDGSPGFPIKFGYAGRFYWGSARTPQNLFTALSKIPTELLKKLEIHLIGTNMDGEVQESIRSGMLPVHLHPRMEHREALQFLSTMDVLLLWANGNILQVPSKFFEYIGMCKPILVFSPHENDASVQMLKELKRGWWVHNSPDAIADFLLSFLANPSAFYTGLQLSPQPEFSWEHRVDQWKKVLCSSSTAHINK